MHIDKLLEKLNPSGPYQILNWFAISIFATFPPAWHQFAITFTAYFPSDYGCVTNATLASNVTTSDGLSRYMTRSPIAGSPCLYEASYYADSSSTELLHSSNETCSGSDDFWFTDQDPVKSTIITEWNLVCSREILSVIVSAAEGMGEIAGCIVFGLVADRFGRKISFFGSGAVLFFSGLLCTFAPHYSVAIIARIFIGMSLTGMLNIGFLFNTELFTPKVRGIFPTLGELNWAIAVTSLTAFGYLLRDVFSFSLAITLPIVLMIPLWWFLRESIHWQLAHGKLDDVRDTLRHIARFNKVQIDEDMIESAVTSEAETIKRANRSVTPAAATPETQPLTGVEKKQVEPNVFDLFKSRRLRMITIILTLIFFANTLCYYGLQLAAQLTEGVDFYLSFFILAAVEIPSTFAVIPAMVFIGRRWSLIIFQIIAGILCIAVPFVPEDHKILALLIAATGKFFGSASFTVIYVYATELYPTCLRGTGFGMVSVLGRIGMVVAPFVNSLGYGESMSVFPPWARMVIYGGGLIVTGFLTLPLPETNKQPLAETVEQMENYEDFCREYHRKNAEREAADEQKENETSA